MTTERSTATNLDGEQARRSDEARAATTHAAPWLVIALLGVLGFIALTILVAGRTTLPFDQPWLDQARTWSAWATLWRFLSESANIPLVIIGIGMVGWLFFTGRRREALVVLVLLIAMTAGSEGVKQLVARPRPEGTDPNIPGVVYSYPSGHTLEALTIFGIIALRCWRTFTQLGAKVLLAVIATAEVILVGVARVALSAHYPSDVLAGLLAGAAAVGVYGWLTRPGGFADLEKKP
jgi:undecaprenyl-diphosphatase